MVFNLKRPGYSPYDYLERPGFLVFDEDDQLIFSNDEITPVEVLWHPDGTGAYLSTGDRLYFLSLPEGQLRLISQCQEEEENCSFYDLVWIP